jgi:hypothetical protein
MNCGVGLNEKSAELLSLAAPGPSKRGKSPEGAALVAPAAAKAAEG